MRGIDFKNFIRKQSLSDDDTFPDTDVVLYANIAKDWLAEKIQSQIDEGFFEITETRNLIKGQREYTLPADLLLSIKKAWLWEDGKYKHMEEFDVSQYNIDFDNELIKKNFVDPKYDITGRAMRIFSGKDIEDADKGLKIIGSIYPKDLEQSDLLETKDLSEVLGSDADKKHSMPRATHYLWANIIIEMYKMAKDKPVDMRQILNLVETELKDVLSKLSSRNRDTNYIPSIPFNDGSNY